jgi:hypothetical protein
LLRAVYYSVWCYLLVAVVAIIVGFDRTDGESFYRRHKADPADLVWIAALLVLVPAMVVATATRAWDSSRGQRGLLRLLRINERHEQPTGWDYWFRKGRNCYVRILMKDGGRVLGFYGAESFAAYAKDGSDLYLERVYVPEGEHQWFGAQPSGNCGIWVRSDEVVSIEFYDPDYAAEDSAAEASGQGTSDGGTQAADSDQPAPPASSASSPDQ